jgi:hypothetical protein
MLVGGGKRLCILDQVLALQHLQAIGDAAQVHTARIAADFATDAAGT